MELNLTPAQATVLTTILESVGGFPDGPRVLSDDILAQLYNEGAQANIHLLDGQFANRIMLVDNDGNGAPATVVETIAQIDTERH